MKFIPSFLFNSQHKAILCAILSQSVWLPVFISGYQDKWSVQQSNANSYAQFQNSKQLVSASPYSSSLQTFPSEKFLSKSTKGVTSQTTGTILNSVLGYQQSSLPEISRSLTTTNSLNSTYGVPQPSNPYKLLAVAESKQDSHSFSSTGGMAKPQLFTNNFVQRLYSRSELLGGMLTLQDLSEPVMPPIARAERAQWSRSGDPLAPLPEAWREPMRRALNSLINTADSAKAELTGKQKANLRFDSARFVHVPSTKIRQTSEVPLALQADGTVDILNKPDDPAVIDEINRWSARQKLPEQGKISPAVVRLHPIEKATINTASSSRLPPTNQTEQGKLNSTLPVVSSSELPPDTSQSPASTSPPPVTTVTAPVAVQESSSAGQIAPTPVAPAASSPTNESAPAPPSESES